MRTFCRGNVDTKTATLADITTADTGEMDNRFLNNSVAGPAGRYPFSVDFANRSIHNQNLVWSMVCGPQHYHGR